MRFSFLLSVTIILFALSIETETINLSNYEYPKKLDASEGLVNIAIMGTNDIHGTFYPKFVSLNEQEDKYEVGGLSYLGKYISMMREDWGDRFLWFDGGDQFQGGLETRLGNGEIMTEFFNIMEVNASTFGNHEFDYGPDYLRNRTQHSKFPYVVCNIQNKTTKETCFKLFKYFIIEIFDSITPINGIIKAIPKIMILSFGIKKTDTIININTIIFVLASNL